MKNNRGLFPMILIPIAPMFVRRLALLFIAFALAACAVGPRVVDHSFGFDTRDTIPRVEVLDYRYGDSKLPVPPDWAIKEGRPFYFENVTGPMLVGDRLYVKWRIKDTGQVYEETVDLRHRLPTDIKDHRVYFDIKGSQLYVYLISPEKLNPNPCPSRDELRRLGNSDDPGDRIFSTYCYRKIMGIYPDQSKH